MLNIVTKTFNELTIDELYAVLQLRSAVFVVEQNCVYQDMDGNDQKALHILGYKQNSLVAYTRLFRAGDYFEYASIGRVLVKKGERHLKYGYAIMEASIDAIEKGFQQTKIKISAQTYLKEFYNNLGFVQVGQDYFEDGIPHIGMIKD